MFFFSPLEHFLLTWKGRHSWTWYFPYHLYLPGLIFWIFIHWGDDVALFCMFLGNCFPFSCLILFDLFKFFIFYNSNWSLLLFLLLFFFSLFDYFHFNYIFSRCVYICCENYKNELYCLFKEYFSKNSIKNVYIYIYINDCVYN